MREALGCNFHETPFDESGRSFDASVVGDVALKDSLVPFSHETADDDVGGEGVFGHGGNDFFEGLFAHEAVGRVHVS